MSPRAGALTARPARFGVFAAVASAVLALAPAAVAATTATTWYVSAAAAPGGTGTKSAPFNSLAAVEQASGPGDTIIVLPSAGPPLDGGIALKPNQHLLGGGPAVVGSTLAALPTITNTSATLHNGDGVDLANGATVNNLKIVNTYRGAVYGSDVSGVTISGNDIAAMNTSCTDGFFIAPFTFPTNAPGVGAPLSTGLKNGFAGIMIDATSATGTVTVRGNSVHDGACADGIDLRLSGTANLTATIANNTVSRLNNGGDHQSVLAIGAQTSGAASLTDNVSYNTETYIGGTEADSEGLFGYPSDTSRLSMTVSHNTFAHGVGGLGPNGRSANGTEFVILSGNPTASMSIADSSFTDTSGDLIEELNWGVNSTMHLSLQRVTASDSTGLGDTVGLPFNNGDCLLESSAGAGTTTTLSVASSRLVNCVGNGLTVHNNVVNGSGPANSLAFDVNSSVIDANRSHNLRVANLTALNRLSGRVQNSDLSGSAGTDVGFDQVGGTTGSSALDLGGGALNSKGNNCIFGGGLLDAEADGYNVFAENNWWGSASGPGPGRVVTVNNGSIRTAPFLTARPTTC